MRQSQLFTKTKKEAPKDEVSNNAELLIRGGFVHKEMAGVYSFLPLGVRVLAHIECIIREEMDALGGQEIRMATLHPSEPWKKTGGWDTIDVLFKLTSRTDNAYALGQSEEEIVTPIAQEYVLSYKDLPLAVYQIGQKYRDELRAKSGVMRGREFGMKDMYSFHTSQEDFNRFYEIVKKSYLTIFERMGLRAKVTEASGGSFSKKISYEFMVLTDAGEDNIFYCDVCEYCVNQEIATVNEKDLCPKCQKQKLQASKASEVGNVFDLGQKYTKDFGCTYMNETGERKYPLMGCYGIGTTRLMGVVAEALSDEAGLVWPESIAPFRVHLLSLGADEKALELYTTLKQAGISVLYDDRDERAGVKFAESDLIGIPYRVIVSKRSLEAGTVEVKKRTDKDATVIPFDRLITFLK
ncbi:MAG TPA: aminoacyl--tRNA ligase-related protein [Patescibacteria group bacterium]|nr:aminoacyl--tRNA ligase-related protein [Patescibacteria group bacterium]